MRSFFEAKRLILKNDSGHNEKFCTFIKNRCNNCI